MTSFPQHIAIIMDGNGRWAKAKGLTRIRGHEEGVNRVREIVEESGRMGLRYLTLYAFSSENWKRPKFEVELLMLLLRRFAAEERNRLCEQNVRLNLIGDLSKIPSPVRKELEKTLDATSHNDGLTLTLALSYGGRAEILRAIKRLVESGSNLTNLDEDEFTRFLDTKSLPDPDMVVRTSGEERLSNFLVWQAAYAELIFTKCYWPEFTKEALWDAIRTYQKRERRYGRLSPQDESRPLYKAQPKARRSGEKAI